MSFFTDTFDQFTKYLQNKSSSIYCILVINQNKGQFKIRTLAFWPKCPQFLVWFQPRILILVH